MPTFTPDPNPGPGSSLRVVSSVFESRYGDGYTQRSPAGINSVRRQLSLQWETISPADADVIVAFMEDKRTVAFHYTYFRDGVDRTWNVSNVSRPEPDSMISSLTLTLEENFDLAVPP